MEYTVASRAGTPSLRSLVVELGRALERAGFDHPSNGSTPDFVLNVFEPEAPRPFRRRSRGTFVAALHERPQPPNDVLRETYPLLVRALANVGLCYVPPGKVWFTTMEQGAYAVQGRTAAELAERVVERLEPLARARLVIDNEFRADLEPELWRGDGATDEIRLAGVRLGWHGLLPAPFPIENLLDERDLRHVKRLYGIGGLSYGNLSRRQDARRFWMSASGVDKTRLELPGRDVLLVADYEPEPPRIVVSVRPDVEPRRVSVDAIEHWMVYREHADVGAILHIHAWIEGIQATEVNYPSTTRAEPRSSRGASPTLSAGSPNPAHAVVGLRNHGITATGSTLTEILDRIEPRLLRQVPMS